MICVQCGKETNRPKSKYCGMVCKNRYLNSRYKKQKKVYTKKCVVCGGEFETLYIWQILCTNPECRKHRRGEQDAQNSRDGKTSEELIAAGEVDSFREGFVIELRDYYATVRDVIGQMGLKLDSSARAVDKALGGISGMGQ